MSDSMGWLLAVSQVAPLAIFAAGFAAAMALAQPGRSQVERQRPPRPPLFPRRTAAEGSEGSERACLAPRPELGEGDDSEDAKTAVAAARWHSLPPMILTIVAGAVLATYLATVLAYLAAPAFFFDHVEPQIAAVAYRALEGVPIYHPIDAAERYALLYGPAAYLILLPFYAVLGGTLVAAKLPGAMALVGTLALTWMALGRQRPANERLTGLGVMALVLMGYGASGYWVRPDPALMLAAALPLPCLAARRPGSAAAGVAVGLALAFTLKAHGVVYLLPPLALLLTRHGWRPALAAVLGGSALAPLAFLHPAVSVIDYVAWLRLAVGHGLSVGVLAANLQQAALLALPAVAMAWAARRGVGDRAATAYVAVLIGALAITALIAAKPLAGPRHLMPFLPVVLHACFELRSTVGAWFPIGHRGPLVAAWLITAAVTALPAQHQVFDEARRFAVAGGAVEEITAILADNPGRGIEMGYSGSAYRLSLARPLLVYAGNPYSLDAAALMDMQASGLPLPVAAIAQIDSCATELWLLPKGATPFAIRNIYPPNPSLFDAAFVAAFVTHYEIKESRQFFDLWGCR